MRLLCGIGKGVVFNIDLASKSQRLFGLEEAEIAPAIMKFAKKAQTIVDIGASDGYYTTVLAVRNPRAKVVAIDPEPSMRERCRKNLEMNGIRLSERISYLSEFVGTGVEFNCVTLDSILKEAKDPICIKIDVDGPELDVLRSAEKTLRSNECRLVVETHSKILEKDCIKYLESLSYRCRIIKNAWWRLFVPELRPIEHNRWFIAKRQIR